MSFLDIAMNRYSVRSYKDIAVEEEKILRVLEAARIAPSAVNYQPIHFIVLTDPKVKHKMSEVYGGKWLLGAPVIIVACGDHSKSWKRKDGKDHCDIDVAIAIDHMTLAAADIGLGTCWICAIDSKRCHELLALPQNLEVVALLPLGYPAEDRATDRKRISLKDMVSWQGEL